MDRTFDVEMAEKTAHDLPTAASAAADDDGRPRRTGTLWTATAHIITAVIGSGVLSLGWANAQLGWVAGPVALVIFSAVTWFTSILLADCYRSPDPINGKRNHTYMEAVKANLGRPQLLLCGVAQYANLVGVSIGYTITGSVSMAAVRRSNCFHTNGHGATCHVSEYWCVVIFGLVQLLLSQLPSFHKLEALSILAAVMSFSYSGIGVGLSIAKIAGGSGSEKSTLTGISVGPELSEIGKVWRVFQALGNIAFAYTFSMILVEIQDTLRSDRAESKVMKKATTMGVTTTTVFYVLCGCLGYAAFGNGAPGNFLTGFGFYEPYWLVDLGNICIVVHLLGAYQVFSQPWFKFVEDGCRKQWPSNGFLQREYNLRVLRLVYPFSFFRLVWRTCYVVFTTVVAMIFPFFNDFVGLLGASAFWPLTVYLPIEMHLARTKVRSFSAQWICLKLLSGSCLLISVAAGVGCIQGLVTSVSKYQPFH